VPGRRGGIATCLLSYFVTVGAKLAPLFALACASMAGASDIWYPAAHLVVPMRLIATLSLAHLVFTPAKNLTCRGAHRKRMLQTQRL